MCRREPKLLKLSQTELLQRLIDTKLSVTGNVIDVLELAEKHPRLLLPAERSVDKAELPAEQIPAWEHGLVSDCDSSWRQHYEQLREFFQRYGHSHIGFADRDSSDLSAWAEKQRTDGANSALLPDRRKKLEVVQFEFDSAEAEWLRWFYERKATREVHKEPTVLTSSEKIFLTNWCSVQRVAYKSGCLTHRRELLLESLGFEWNIPDPLSGYAE